MASAVRAIDAKIAAEEKKRQQASDAFIALTTSISALKADRRKIPIECEKQTMAFVQRLTGDSKCTLEFQGYLMEALAAHWTYHVYKFPLDKNLADDDKFTILEYDWDGKVYCAEKTSDLPWELTGIDKKWLEQEIKNLQEAKDMKFLIDKLLASRRAFVLPVLLFCVFDKSPHPDPDSDLDVIEEASDSDFDE